MKNKNIALTISLLAIFLAILVAPMLNAAVLTSVVNDPLNYSNNSGTMVANCTTSAHNVLNVTFFANSSDGTATNFTIGTIVNTSAAQTNFYNAVMSVTAQDGKAYNVTCYVDNSTDQLMSNAQKGITFDSTNPSCSLTGDHNIIPYKGNILLTWTSSDALELISTSVVIDGPQDQTTVTDTDANEARTLTSQETKYFGDWTVNITGTDRADNTCIAYFNFSSYLPDGEIWEGPAAPVDTGKILLLLGIVGVIAYFVFFKKK